MRVGWAFPQDWWVPAVDAVAEALCDGRDPAAACAQLGRSRAGAAVGLAEAMDDLAALYAAYTGPDPRSCGRIPVGPAVPSGMVQALALGWAEVAADPTRGGCCEDPMTGLAVPGYLRVRLGEVYRGGQLTGIPVPATHALVVVEVPPASGWLVQASRSLVVAQCLQATFAGGETLCAVGPCRALALVARDGGLAARAATLLRLVVAEVELPAGQVPRVWVEGLPGTLAAAHRLVAELAR
jgi:hypothetical protein